MTWKACREAVRDLLDGVAITEPEVLTVKRVFEFPPAAVEAGDVPCFVMIPPARRQEWGPAYARTKYYTQRIQLLARDETASDAVNIADAFAESVMDVLIPSMELANIDSALTIVSGPQIEQPSGFVYGGRAFIGFEMEIEFRYDEAGLGFAR